ncbi:MAG TPA: M56 family metallopeptidase [Vicinamibacterales bacterium]|nr:M56 family metallopeptidase [Vicinamibacterales bacterium]
MKEALALALVHFVWQGALLAMAGAVLMRVTRAPTVRYAIGIATMLAMLLAPVTTFLAIRSASDATLGPPQPATFTPAHAVAEGDLRTRTSIRAVSARDATPSASALTAVIVPTAWILNIWGMGVLVLSLRFVGGWAVTRRLASGTLIPVAEELQALAAEVAERLNVRGAVRVCESASVAVPMMLGCLRPVIILPPAALVMLSAAQLEALLAHELAHIRRHDYLVNLLQTGVETLCFYHPAVWWISREVRQHREHCCDDIAVGVCDRLTYVTALSSLASLATPQFALSAAGGSLRDRVRRLIEPTTHSASPKGAWIAMLPILLVISFVAPHAWGTQSATPLGAQPVIEMDQARSTVAPTAPVEVSVAEEAVQATRATTAREAVRQRQLERTRAEAERAVEARAATSQERTREVRREVDRALAAERAARAAGTRNAMEQSEARRALGESDLALLESRMRLEELGLARRKELADKGLATRQTLLESEAQLNHTRREVEHARIQHELATHERLATTHRNFSELDSTDMLEAQDRLTISIDGEPDLPTMFTVRDDGSIRFPFLGSIRVQGSTASQVQSAIRKLLSDKGLARNAVVSVSASRIR